ncbi:hypothetical protein RFN29_25770 [Mesorhizobium sp. VK22B]|uniref:Uncharacterized protein n=1 Tax=Mesorhizobium captivum TaxID=3072319 RepID=A0ABU4Z6Z7_9HYPH|nr:hypothetical protein [Mesorhizobium sp. VK22B]MDX8494971.1 hypothetical protein [Mesorhizobium sp. VK22B]
MPKPITDNDVAVRITPQVIHWRDTASLMHWTDLKAAVDAARDVVVMVDQQCRAIEADGDLSPEGIARKRIEIAQKAMADLADFKPLKKAESSVARAVSTFQGQMTSLPKKPDHVADVMVAQEVRAHVAKQPSPATYVLNHLNNPQIVAAVLHAPAFLSSLEDTDLAVIKERAGQTLHPDQVRMSKEVTDALAHLREGIEAAKRLILERTDARHDRDDVMRSKKDSLSKAIAAE